MGWNGGRPQEAPRDQSGSRHHSVVETAARRYQQHLRQSIRAGLSPRAERAAEQLLASIDNALRAGERLRPDKVSFTFNSMKGFRAAEKLPFINQWCLGLGDDGAEVVVMGSERVFDPEDDRGAIALESCGSPIMWLSDGVRGPAISRRLLQGWDPAWGQGVDRPYHRHPYDYFKVPSNHAWRLVAATLDVPLHDLGDRCYQIERSVVSSRKAREAPPSRERLAFLEEMLGELRQTARLLIIHGRTDPAEESWAAANCQLADAFLGAPGMVEGRLEDAGQFQVQVWMYEDRTVMFTPALSGSMRGLRPSALARISDLATSSRAPRMPAATPAPMPAPAPTRKW